MTGLDWWDLDWCVPAATTRGSTLHALHPDQKRPHPQGMDHRRIKDAHLACGRTATVNIPGVLSRLSRPRCRQCCRAMNYPSGYGSPKNDPQLRVLLTGGEGTV